MVDMGVARNQIVDILGIDASGFEVADEEAHVFGALDRSHPGLEQGELVAGVDDERVLIHHQLIGGQKAIGHHLFDVGSCRPDEGGLRYADDQTVRHDCSFDVADVEAIEGRRLGLEERRLGGSRTRAAYEVGRGGCRCAGEQMTARQSRIDHLIHSLTVMMLVANADGVCKRKPTPNAEKPPPPLNAHRSATAASSRCLAELRRGKRSAAPRIIGKPVPSDRRCGNDAIDGRGSAGRSAESFPEAALNQTDET